MNSTVFSFAIYVLSFFCFCQVCSPFFDARSHQTYYAGPGRERPAATDVKEVAIGYFGPSTSLHPEGGDMWRSACLAVDQANQAGGYRGLPFRLVPGWSDSPWGSGITQVTRMIYVHNVWAIIGGIDGPSTHLAEQVVAKARLTLLSPGCTDRTANCANVPWMFSCLPQYHLQAPVLAEAIAREARTKPFILVSAVDHDSHLFTVELARHFVELRLSPSYHYEFDPRMENIKELAQQIADTRVDVLVLVAGAQPSAQFLCAVRERGFTGRIFGGPCMGQRSFVEQAGQAADGVVFPLLYTSSTQSKSPDLSGFIRRFGQQPDYLAAHTYDAVNLLVDAIRKAGLNRVRICDAVREISPWRGVTGSIQWDSLGSNSRPVGLGTIRNGRLVPKDKS